MLRRRGWRPARLYRACNVEQMALSSHARNRPKWSIGRDRACNRRRRHVVAVGARGAHGRPTAARGASGPTKATMHFVSPARRANIMAATAPPRGARSGKAGRVRRAHHRHIDQRPISASASASPPGNCGISQRSTPRHLHRRPYSQKHAAALIMKWPISMMAHHQEAHAGPREEIGVPATAVPTARQPKAIGQQRQRATASARAWRLNRPAA